MLLQQECTVGTETMVFSGNVSGGVGTVVLVVSTGMDSEFGKIANLTQNTEKKPFAFAKGTKCPD